MKIIALFLKIYSFILFVNVGLFFLAMITGAMRDGGFDKLIIVLFIGWMIALTIFFSAHFLQKVRRAEEKFDTIKRKYDNKKESNFE